MAFGNDDQEKLRINNEVITRTPVSSKEPDRLFANPIGDFFFFFQLAIRDSVCLETTGC